MKSIKLIFFTIMLIAFSTHLYAQISDTNQIKCYNLDYEIQCPEPGEDFYGQDGNYIINMPSFTKLDSLGNELSDASSGYSMVKDNITGLIWEVKQNNDSIQEYENCHDANNDYVWNNAESDIDNVDQFLSCINSTGVYNDWRLPDIKELMSLLDLSVYYPAIDQAIFPQTQMAAYWSSTIYQYDPDKMWYTKFSYGTNHQSAQSSPKYVRAVRGRYPWPQDRFKKNDDHTITDTTTGLMWQEQLADTKKSWDDALSYCEDLELSGYNDWRLPNFKEILSIADYQRYSPAVDTDFFDNIKSSYYWTSTTAAQFPGFAWGIFFRNGSFTNTRNKSNLCYVIAVRGGQRIQPDSLIITFPLASTTLSVEQALSIKWEDQDIAGNVRILFSRQGGKTDTFKVLSESTENDGEYTWTATGPASANCMLKIEPLNQPDKGAAVGLFSVIENFPPEISSIEDQTTDEDANLTLSFNVNDKETAPCDLIFRTFSHNHSLIQEIKTISYTPCDQRSIEIIPAKNMFGSTTIDVTVVDEGGLRNTSSFALTILPVNDCPNFSINNREIEIDNDGEIKVFENWFTHINAGPNETDELSFVIEPSEELEWAFNEDKNGKKPEILISSETSQFGTLQFKPSSVFFDSVAIKIVLKDNGDLERGGCNTYTDTLNIKVNRCTLSILTTKSDLFENPYPVFESEFLEKQIRVRCGNPPYTFSVSQGILPPNLYLQQTKGIILSGYFTDVGIFNFSIKVQDSDESVATKKYDDVEVVKKLQFEQSDKRLISAILGRSYPSENKVLINGGKRPYVIALCDNSPSLPAPLQLKFDNDAFMIDGTPGQSETFSFSVCVSSADGQSISKTFQLDIVDPLIIQTKKLHTGLIEEYYEMFLEAKGGYHQNNNCTYKWFAENLPVGLYLNSEEGKIYGTVSEKDVYHIKISVSDMDGHVSYEFLPLWIEDKLLEINDDYLPSGIDGEQYSEEIKITGGFPPYTVECVGLPYSLECSNTGIISGIPQDSDEKTIDIKVIDNQFPEPTIKYWKKMHIKITDILTIITSGTLPPVEKGKMMTPVPLESRGGTEPYSYSIGNVFSQIGLYVNENNALEGNPTTAGIYLCNIIVTDSKGISAEKMFYLEVYAPLTIPTYFIADAYVDKPYSQDIEVKGGYGRKNWKCASPLPTGLTFNVNTGVISGLPTQSYPPFFTVNIQVKDALDNIAQKSFPMEVLGRSVKMIANEIYNGYAGINYIANLYPSWGKPKYFWELSSGSLPNGLALNTANPLNPQITGIPEQTGSFTFEIQLTDSSTPQGAVIEAFGITISEIAADKITIITPHLKEAIIKRDDFGEFVPNSYLEYIIARGGNSGYQFDIIKGTLPDGLTLNSENGMITGTITPSSKTTDFTVRAMDAEKKVKHCDKTFLLLVTEELKIITENIPSAMQWREYQYVLSGVGGISPYRWTITHGKFPAGLKLNPITGAITGNPVECGDFDLIINLQDSSIDRQNGSRTLSIGNLHVGCGDNLIDIIYILQALSGFDTIDTETFLGTGADDIVGLDDLIYSLNHILELIKGNSD
jgi:hypothetical protein